MSGDIKDALKRGARDAGTELVITLITFGFNKIIQAIKRAHRKAKR